MALSISSFVTSEKGLVLGRDSRRSVVNVSRTHSSRAAPFSRSYLRFRLIPTMDSEYQPKEWNDVLSLLLSSVALAKALFASFSALRTIIGVRFFPCCEHHCNAGASLYDHHCLNDPMSHPSFMQ